MRRHVLLGRILLGLVLALTAIPAAAASGDRQHRVDRGDTTVRSDRTDRAVPGLRVRTLARGLELPWDVQQIGRGEYLVTERANRRLLLLRRGELRRVRFPSRSVWSSGETGLMSLAIDPDFARSRRIWTCQGGFRRGGGHDVRVVAWRLGRRHLAAKRLRVVLSGIQATSGRHGGCRLLLVGKRRLHVGTGDAAVGTNPRRLTSLNGKVLRLHARTGEPWPSNPWAGSRNRNKRYVLTFGHRNVQGLARRRDGSLWSVEHGSFRDDEVNRLRRRGDYGWHPVPNDAGDPAYNEEVPMTDHSLPGRQVSARWRSGTPTIATSGATWVRGRKWGRLRGTLAVAALAGERLVFMRFSRSGRLRWTRTPAATRQLGRLRSVSRAANNDLLVTTSNGTGDRVLRVSPRR
jgi:glucose/arabinose dehydrogenase